MKIGRYFISTGFSGSQSGHLLVALHMRWRLASVRPHGKPGYRRLYIGPIEIEWSRQGENPSPQTMSEPSPTPMQTGGGV